MALPALLVLIHCLNYVSAKPAPSLAPPAATKLINKDYFELHQLLGKNLDGTAEENTKVVDLVLQILAEIDLPTLCEVIANDTRSHKGVFGQSSTTQGNATPDWQNDVSESTKMADEIIQPFPGEDIAVTLGNTEDMPSAMTSQSTQGTESVTDNTHEEFVTASKQRPATYTYHRDELSSMSTDSEDFKQMNMPDPSAAYTEYGNAQENSYVTSDANSESNAPQESENDDFGNKMTTDGTLSYPIVHKQRLDSFYNLKLSPAFSPTDLKELQLKSIYKRLADDSSKRLDGDNLVDDVHKNVIVKSMDVERPRSQLYSRALVLGDWVDNDDSINTKWEYDQNKKLEQDSGFQNLDLYQYDQREPRTKTEATFDTNGIAFENINAMSDFDNYVEKNIDWQREDRYKDTRLYEPPKEKKQNQPMWYSLNEEQPDFKNDFEDWNSDNTNNDKPVYNSVEKSKLDTPIFNEDDLKSASEIEEVAQNQREVDYLEALRSSFTVNDFDNPTGTEDTLKEMSTQTTNINTDADLKQTTPESSVTPKTTEDTTLSTSSAEKHWLDAIEYMEPVTQKSNDDVNGFDIVLGVSAEDDREASTDEPEDESRPEYVQVKAEGNTTNSYTTSNQVMSTSTTTQTTSTSTMSSTLDHSERSTKLATDYFAPSTPSMENNYDSTEIFYSEENARRVDMKQAQNVADVGQASDKVQDMTTVTSDETNVSQSEPSDESSTQKQRITTLHTEITTAPVSDQSTDSITTTQGVISTTKTTSTSATVEKSTQVPILETTVTDNSNIHNSTKSSTITAQSKQSTSRGTPYNTTTLGTTLKNTALNITTTTMNSRTSDKLPTTDSTMMKSASESVSTPSTTPDAPAKTRNSTSSSQQTLHQDNHTTTNPNLIVPQPQDGSSTPTTTTTRPSSTVSYDNNTPIEGGEQSDYEVLIVNKDEELIALNEKSPSWIQYENLNNDDIAVESISTLDVENTSNELPANSVEHVSAVSYKALMNLNPNTLEKADDIPMAIDVHSLPSEDSMTTVTIGAVRTNDNELETLKLSTTSTVGTTNSREATVTSTTPDLVVRTESSNYSPVTKTSKNVTTSSGTTSTTVPTTSTKSSTSDARLNVTNEVHYSNSSSVSGTSGHTTTQSSTQTSTQPLTSDMETTTNTANFIQPVYIDYGNSRDYNFNSDPTTTTGADVEPTESSTTTTTTTTTTTQTSSSTSTTSSTSSSQVNLQSSSLSPTVEILSQLKEQEVKEMNQHEVVTGRVLDVSDPNILITDENMEQTTESVDNKDQQTTESVDNKDQQTTESVDNKDQQTTESVDNKDQQTTESGDNKDQQTTESVDNKDQQTTESVDNKNQQTTESVDNKDQQTTESVDNKDQQTTESADNKDLNEVIINSISTGRTTIAELESEALVHEPRLNITVNDLKDISSKIADAKANLTELNENILKQMEKKSMDADEDGNHQGIEIVTIHVGDIVTGPSTSAPVTSATTEKFTVSSEDKLSGILTYSKQNANLTILNTTTLNTTTLSSSQTSSDLTPTLSSTFSSSETPAALNTYDYTPESTTTTTTTVTTGQTLGTSGATVISVTLPRDYPKESDNIKDDHYSISDFEDFDGSENSVTALDMDSRTDYNSKSRSESEMWKNGLGFFPGYAVKDKYPQKPKSRPYMSGIPDWADQYDSNNFVQPDVFSVDPWKAYNIAVGEQKSKPVDQIYQRQVSPQTQLYSDLGQVPTTEENLVDHFLWKARSWPKGMLTDKEKLIQKRKMLAEKLGHAVPEDLDVDVSEEYYSKLMEKLQKLNDQARKNIHANRWGDRFSQGYYGRVFDDKRVFGDSSQTLNIEPSFSQEMINFDTLEKVSKDYKEYVPSQTLRNRHIPVNYKDFSNDPASEMNNGADENQDIMTDFAQYADFNYEDSKFKPDHLKVEKIEQLPSALNSERNTVNRGVIYDVDTLRTDVNPVIGAKDISQWSGGLTVSSDSEPAPGDYKCPGLFGYHSDPNDCRAFFICSWGMPYRVRCPPGTLFNPKQAVCDWAVNVRCPVSQDRSSAY